MTHRNEIAIQLRNVTYEVDHSTILHQISGQFYKGKITNLVGPSGSGKTTLLKMCNGLISPTSGEILINNYSINTYEPTTLRRNIGIVLQNAPILRTTVFENLVLPLQLQNKTLTETKASELLTEVGLDPKLLHRQANELSGGQKQKINIARTLLNEPNILLLDEITSALDPNSTSEVEELIHILNQKYSITVIWITHNIEQAKRIGDFTWVLKDGQLIESGESSSVLEKNLFNQDPIGGNNHDL